MESRNGLPKTSRLSRNVLRIGAETEEKERKREREREREREKEKERTSGQDSMMENEWYALSE